VAWQFAADLGDALDARPWLSLTIGPARLVVGIVDGAWFGIEDRCTHAGCAFSEDGELAGRTLICDCHGSEFDVRTGAVLRGPAALPLRTWPVRVAADCLEVDV
jgi:nitrite reductase/ring-hydroxylating ferredoxin subunit